MSTEYLKSLNSDYDILFNAALHKELTFLPWVGKEYGKDENAPKLLVIGESHYTTQSVDEIMDDPEFTRTCIVQSRIGYEWIANTFASINRVLVGEDSLQTGKILWEHIAFYNFVQRPMESSGHRPQYNDWMQGWKSFIEVVKILKPTVCLFIGVSATDYFNESMRRMNISHTPVQWCEQINLCHPRACSITLEETKLPIFAIRHCGSFFSWRLWRDYLWKKIPEALSFIGSMTKYVAVGEHSDEPADEPRSTELDVPTWLSHKPIIACRYPLKGHERADDFDAKFISVGRAQYDNEGAATVKVWRKTWNTDRWSRQSEEVPIERLGHMMELLLSAMLHCQKTEPFQSNSSLQEQDVTFDADQEFLRAQVHGSKEEIFKSLSNIKTMLGQIDPDKF